MRMEPSPVLRYTLSQFAACIQGGSAGELQSQRIGIPEQTSRHWNRRLSRTLRMNGGSLRFWEAHSTILLTADPNNMMNSPHGWTASVHLRAVNMYQLTGDPYCLERE